MARTRIWMAAKDPKGNIVPRVVDVDGYIPDEYYTPKHPQMRPFLFSLWQEGRPPQGDAREGHAAYAQWWWDEDARRTDEPSSRFLSFPGLKY